MKSKTPVSAMVLVVLSCISNVAQAQVSAPAPNGPRLGISVERSSANGIQGVRVVSDYKRRWLFSNSGRQYRFRIGYDVITHVNGRNVGSASDVIRALRSGRNVLKIHDRYTGNTDYYKVYIN